LTVIDRRGRLFGRVNLVDAAILALVLILVPLAYTAYLLFRMPAPEVAAVEPAAIGPGKATSVRLTGRHFRPYLRVSAGSQMGTFLVASTTTAEVKLPPLEPGAYDLVLYDGLRELARRPGALTVEALRSRKTLYGAFTGFTEPQANDARRGLADGTLVPPAWARLLEVFAPQPASNIVGNDQYRVPAAIEVECVAKTAGCAVGEVTLKADGVLPIPFPEGAMNFRIEAVMPSDLTPLEVVMRVQGPPEIADMAKPGDTDSRGPGQGPRFQTTLLAFDRGAGTVRFRVPARDQPSGWEYNGFAIKVGYAFSFETSRYAINGVIIGFRAPEPTSGSGRSSSDKPSSAPREPPSAMPSGLTPIEVVMRIQGPRELADIAKPGDTDARGPGQDPRLQRTLLALNRGAATARFRVPALDTPSGWEYNGHAIKAGYPFAFETSRYSIKGVVVDVRAADREHP
jgi:uncharacterized protein DUF4330